MPAPTSTLRLPGLPDFSPQPPTSPAANFPLTPLLDDFNRADNPPGANWRTPWLNNGQLFSVLSNRGAVTGAGAGAAAWVQSYGPDCEVWVQGVVLPAAGSRIFLHLRKQTLLSVASNDGYDLRVTPSTSTWELRLLSQAGSTVLATYNQPFKAGDWMGFRADGSTLSAYYSTSGTYGDWLLVGTATDPTFTQAVGYIGLQTNDTTGVVRWDNFGGGAIDVADLLMGYIPNALIDPVMPPTGLTLYPSQQPYYPAVAGGPFTYQPTGSLTASVFFAGADVFEASETGALTPFGLLSGADAFNPNETGSLIAGTNLSGADVFNANEAGSLTPKTLFSGADASTFSETGALLVGTTLSGADAHDAIRLGSLTPGTTLSGADVFTASETGSLIVGALFSGVSVKITAGLYVKAGSLTPGALLSGADAFTASETGSLVTGALVSGADAHTAVRAGSLLARAIVSAVSQYVPALAPTIAASVAVVDSTTVSVTVVDPVGIAVAVADATGTNVAVVDSQSPTVVILSDGTRVEIRDILP